MAEKNPNDPIGAVERIYNAWDEALGAKDLDAAVRSSHSLPGSAPRNSRETALSGCGLRQNLQPPKTVARHARDATLIIQFGSRQSFSTRLL